MKSPRILSCLLIFVAFVADAKVRLPDVIADHMMLQRGRAVRIWGEESPGHSVSVRLGSSVGKATAGSNGWWCVVLDTSALGTEPMEMSVSGEDSVTLRDVVVGDVWFASGQSNMEMQMDGFLKERNRPFGEVIGAQELYKRLLGRDIRFFRSKFSWDRARQEGHLDGSWFKVTPETAGSCSATALSFIEKVQGEVGGPMAVVDISIGGSSVWQWMGHEDFAKWPALQKKWEDEKEADSRAAYYEDWRKTNGASFPYCDMNDLLHGTDGWHKASAPGSAAGELPRGCEIFRAKVRLPDDWQKSLAPDARLRLACGSIFATNVVCFLACREGVWPNPSGHFFPIREIGGAMPLSRLQCDGGVLTLLVCRDVVFDNARLAVEGISLRRDDTGAELPLSDVQWETKTLKAYPPYDRSLPLPQGYNASHLKMEHQYNHQFYPMRRLSAKGVIWYQGCNDAYLRGYSDYFADMIHIWRRDMGVDADDLPFFYCQLAGQSRFPDSPGEVSPLANVRMEQTATLDKVRNVGMAVILETGEVEVHGRNKIPAGQRLARIALNRVYGRKDIVCEGPLYRRWRPEGNGALVQFTTPVPLKAAEVPATYSVNAYKPSLPYIRRSPNSQLEGFSVRDDKGVWHWADAEIVSRDAVKVSAEGVKSIEAIHYNTGSMGYGNLVNEAGLYASCFITEDGMRDVVSDVNLFVGTEGEGNMTPAAAYPNGMLNPGPDTLGEKDTPCSGYRYSDTAIVGFSQWHLNGTGHPGLGDILLFPFCGETKDCDDAAQRVLDHRRETAVPGYYAIETGDIRSEMTTSRRANVFRFSRVRGNRPMKLLVDLEYCLHRRGNDGRGIDVRTNVTELAEGRRGLSGWTDRKSWGERTFAYALEFSIPWTKSECVSGDGAKAPKYVFSFDVPDGGNLMAKVGFSFGRDDAAARRNIAADIPEWDFDGVRTKAASAWADVLSLVDVEGPSAVRRMFYTSLYHAYAQPNLMSDVGTPDRYTLFSLWDTFRAAHPLYTILTPKLVTSFVDSFMDQYAQQGYLPVWMLAGREINCMIANHSVPVIVDAHLKGLVRDPEAAYAAIRNTLTATHPNNPKENWPAYDRHGYFPNDVFLRESCSRTLECAYDDFCAARMAKALGKTDDAEFFARRAGFWRNIYDPSVGFVRSRNSKGEWRRDFDPYHCGWGDGYDFTEGSSWQYSWHVMQDPLGLIDAMGGKDSFARKLERFFDPNHTELGHGNIKWYSAKELIGQYWHGNEPCQHVPWFWQYVGQGWRTDEIVREIFDRFYLDEPGGLSGNDDCGQMSAWYIFAAFGFYPFNPCGGEYLVNAPQVAKATINLPNGRKFTIRAEGFSRESKYIRAIRLNGKPLNGFVLRHCDIMSGGELVYEMTDRKESK